MTDDRERREAVRRGLVRAGDDLETRIAAGAPEDRPSLEEQLEFAREELTSLHARGKLIGHAAPALTVQWTSDPNAGTLNALRGRVVLLDFFTSWCGPCRAALPHLRAIRSRHAESDLVIVGITSLQGFHITGDDRRIDTEGDETREFEFMNELRGEINMPWPVWFTSESVFNRDFGVRGVPSIAIIDRGGRVRAAGLNPHLDADRIDTTLDELLGSARGGAEE